MKHVLIINPISGTCDPSSIVIPQFQSALVEQSYFVHTTSARGNASQIARGYAEDGERVRFYSCGGDGTLNEILCGCYKYENAEVACIPYGSGNDFIRNFGEKSEFQNILDTLEGETISIDLMIANNGVCAAIASAGIDANVAYGIPTFRRLPLCGGQTAYSLSILRELCKHIGRNMRIKIDDTEIVGEYLLAAVCNGSTYGGGYNAAPCADLTDGLLDVILVKKISRLRIAKVLAIYKKGEHILNGKIIPELQDIMLYKRAKAIQITPLDGEDIIINIDGECEPASSANLSVMPLSAKFVLPKCVYQRYVNKMAIV